jgi:malonyl-CoA/methylmalonyl-CoA synthetase
MGIGDLTARRSLPAAWARRWSEDPDAPLLLDSSAMAPRWYRAGELDDLSRRVAGRLEGLGLRRGDRVLWSTRSSLSGVITNLAALRSGLVVVPLNPAYTAREFAHVLGDVRPAGAIVDTAERASWIGGDRGRGVVVVGPDLEGFLEHATDPGRIVLDDADAGDPALIAYTSGTTGAPKGAVLTHANLLANSESVARTWRWDADDRLVHALPVFHGHGLCVGLYTSLLAGGSVVLLPRFDPEGVLDASAEHRGTLFFGVPTMYHRLLGSRRVGELARLRLAVSGSAPLPAALHGAIAAAAGIEVLERYGMTETLMTLSNPYDGERRPGTVGFPFPGVEFRLADGGDGAGGEILVRGPAVFAGYWERPAATTAALSDGWFRTGDLGVVEDGYVRILGRSTDLIISGGFNVYPAEVEDVLLGHRSVAEVAVTGTPSDEWGEVVTAWVVAEGSAPFDVEGLLAYAAERLAGYKLPRRVRVVDALPRNSMGKVLRSELR